MSLSLSLCHPYLVSTFFGFSTRGLTQATFWPASPICESRLACMADRPISCEIFKAGAGLIGSGAVRPTMYKICIYHMSTDRIRIKQYGYGCRIKRIIQIRKHPLMREICIGLGSRGVSDDGVRVQELCVIFVRSFFVRYLGFYLKFETDCHV